MSALTFQSVLNNTGFHQSNCYDIKVNIPGNSKLVANLARYKITPQVVSQMFSTCCYQVSPNVGTIQTSNVRTYGEPYEVPYGKSYDPVNFGFYMDNDGLMYRILEIWYETIFNSSTRTLGYLNDYACDIEIIFTKRGTNSGSSSTEFMRIVLEKAYPKIISTIPLSGMSSNTITQFDTTFAYRRALYYCYV